MTLERALKRWPRLPRTRYNAIACTSESTSEPASSFSDRQHQP